MIRQGRNLALLRLSVLTLAVGLASLSVLACRGESGNGNGATPSNPFVVGILAPTTGFMSGHGNSIVLGSELARDYLNARGGVLGRQVVLQIADTKSDPGVTAERARELIQRYRVSLLLGTGTSAESLAAIPQATRAGIPFIYSLDGELKTCASGDKNKVSQAVWGSGFTERMVVEPFLRHLQKQLTRERGELTVYFVGGDYVYPKSTNAYARSVAERLGWKIVGEEYSDTATSDYTPVIRRIIAAKPDLLIVTNPGASGVTFMRQAKQLDLGKQMMISGFATFDQEAVDTMGDASEGVYCVNRYSNELTNESNTSFVQAFRKSYPDKPLLPGPTVAAGAYGSLLVAAQAYEKVGAIDPTKFYEKMRGLEIDLPQGRIRVSPVNNIFDQNLYIMQIKNQRYKVIADLGRQSHPNLEGCSVE